MPLRIVFHLDLAKPSTVTTVWDEAESRLRVTQITGGGDLMLELRKHAAEAEMNPSPLFPPLPDAESAEETAWTLLRGYDGLSEDLRAGLNKAFSPLFDGLRINQHSEMGKNLAWGEIRLYLQKPDGEHTNAWVWKDSIRWIQVIEQ